MTDESKKKLKYWIIGLFTGGAVAAPITAFVCKNIYEKKIDEAETNGMNAMAEYAVQQTNDISKQEEKEDKPLTEEDYAEEPGEDIHEYDLSIEDEEARERTEERERYMDISDKYRGEDILRPRMISAEEFDMDQSREKSSVNWYEEDDKFEEELNVITDPYATFGVISGKELFAHADIRPDSEVCYVRNDKLLTDFEISRIHGSYNQMVGGESSLGETDT